MAGSKKFFVYTADDGIEFGILLDESNTEAVNGGTNDVLSGSTLKYQIPRNLKPRRLIYQNSAGTRTVSCVALSQTIYSSAYTSVSTIPDPITSGTTLALVRIEPERIRNLPKGGDSGLNDGDDS